MKRKSKHSLINQASRAATVLLCFVFLCFAVGRSEGQTSDGTEVVGDLELRYSGCFNPAHTGPHTSFIVRDLETRKEIELDISAIDIKELKLGKRVRLQGDFKEVLVAKGIKSEERSEAKGEGMRTFKVTKVTHEGAAGDEGATQAAASDNESMPASEGSEAPTSAAPAVTNLNVLVIHANTPDRSVDASKITAMDDLLFGGTQNASKAIEHASYGHYRLTHGATITVDVAINAAGTDYARMATAMENAATLAGHNPAIYDRYLVCCPDGTESGGSSSWTAKGYFGSSGKTVWSYSWTGRYFDGILHELGHNFGFSHSGKGSNQYNDRTCVMGYSHSSTSGSRCTSTYSATKKVQAGWLAPFPGSHASLTEDATYDIHPISQTPDTTPGMRVVQLDGTDYHISYRRYLLPYAWLRYNSDKDRVFVHTAAGSNESLRVRDMTSGSTYVAGTTTIYFERHGTNNEYATVSFDLADDNDKPIANAQSLTTEMNVPAAITLDGNDSDTMPSDTLTYAVVSDPSNGEVSLVGDQLTYTPATSYIGPDTFVWSVNDGNISSFATVTITVTDSTYNTWASKTFANPFSDNAPSSNPDGDGMNNLMEFAFGTDPTVDDSGSLVADGSVNGLPIPVSSGGNIFDLFFLRRDDHGASGSLTYNPQFNSDLGSFTTSSVTPTFVADSTDDSDYEVVKIPYPVGTRFGRIMVEEVP